VQKVLPYARVKLARDNNRPTGMDYINNIFRRFTELHGDRRFGDDPAVVGGLAWLGDTPVTVIAIEKGHTARERGHRNFGCPPRGLPQGAETFEAGDKLGRPSSAL
jgi:acetyl-CoA carboxylase carboxyl transferase subunit alpha